MGGKTGKQPFSWLPTGQFDRNAFEKFAASVDPSFVESALAATGTATLRKRKLPAEQALWLVIGMSLFRNLSMIEVARELSLVLPDEKGKSSIARSGLTQARTRIGPAPLEWLFEKTAAKWSYAAADASRWRGLALFAVDGTAVRVPDSIENRAHFGGRENQRSDSGYPLVKLVTLMAARSHLLVAARFGPYNTSELTLAKELWSKIPQDGLALVDRGFFFAELLEPLRARGTHWLTRGRKKTAYKVVTELAPGDMIVEMKVSHAARQRDPSLPRTWTARAIRYQRRGFPEQFVFTSLLDPKRFPAAEIVALYHERWEVELGFDEVKTDMLEREESIRSRTVVGVEQELWGLLLAYNLVRLEMTRIAAEAGVPPNRISFKAALRLIRRTLVSLVWASPGVIPKRLAALREEVAFYVLPPRRRERAYPRVVKTKMSHYLKKAPTKVSA